MHYVASKRLRADVDLGRDALLIRTADSGFVYQVEHGEIPPCVLTAVDECAAYLAERGLNILGYDVAYNGKNETALVIEANSAWGMNNYSGPIITDALIKIGDAMNDRTNKR